jgi:hypothetical protein
MDIAQNIVSFGLEIVYSPMDQIPESLLQHFKTQQELIHEAQELHLIQSNPQFEHLAAVADEALTNAIREANEGSADMGPNGGHLVSEAAILEFLEAVSKQTLPSTVSPYRKSFRPRLLGALMLADRKS